MFFKRKKKELSFAECLKEAFPQMRITENADMGAFTSFRCGGRAAVLAEPGNIEELKALLSMISEPSGQKLVILGNGSNTLFADGVFRGVVIKIGSAFAEKKFDEESCRVTAGAGALLSEVAKEASRRGLTGLEFATGIPGSVGGAVYMNAGAYGSDVSAVIDKAKLLMRDGNIRTLSAEELELSYRHSVLEDTGALLLEAEFALARGVQKEIDARVCELSGRRAEKQPLQYPSAGSFFKRPEGRFAGALIEDAGLKGLKLGGAAVSEKHAGFIINEGGATASDVINLMKVVQETVLHKSGVLLYPEVRIIENDA